MHFFPGFFCVVLSLPTVVWGTPASAELNVEVESVGSEPRPLAISTQGVLVVCGIGSRKERAQRAPIQTSVSSHTQWVNGFHWQRTQCVQDPGA